MVDLRQVERYILSLGSLTSMVDPKSTNWLLKATVTRTALTQLKNLVPTLPVRGKFEIQMVASTKRLHLNYMNNFSVHQLKGLLTMLAQHLKEDDRHASKSDDQSAEDLTKRFLTSVMIMPFITLEKAGKQEKIGKRR